MIEDRTRTGRSPRVHRAANYEGFNGEFQNSRGDSDYREDEINRGSYRRLEDGMFVAQLSIGRKNGKRWIRRLRGVLRHVMGFVDRFEMQDGVTQLPRGLEGSCNEQESK